MIIALAAITIPMVAMMLTGAPAFAASILAYALVVVYLYSLTLSGAPHGCVTAAVQPGSVSFGPNQRVRRVYPALVIAGVVNVALFIPATVELSGSVGRRRIIWLCLAIGVIVWGLWGSFRPVRQPILRLTREGLIQGEPHQPRLTRWSEMSGVEIDGPLTVVSKNDSTRVKWLCTLTASDPVIVTSLIARYIAHPDLRDEIGDRTLARVADGSWERP